MRATARLSPLCNLVMTKYLFARYPPGTNTLCAPKKRPLTKERAQRGPGAGAGRRRPAGRRSGARSSERQAAQARGAPSDESIGPGAADRISKRVGQRRWPVSARPALLPPAHPLQFVRAALTSSSLRSSRRWLHGWRTERRPWWTNGLVGGARVAAPGALIARVKLVYSSPSRSMLSRWPPLLARCSTGRSHPTHPRDEKA